MSATGDLGTLEPPGGRGVGEAEAAGPGAALGAGEPVAARGAGGDAAEAAAQRAGRGPARGGEAIRYMASKYFSYFVGCIFTVGLFFFFPVQFLV